MTRNRVLTAIVLLVLIAGIGGYVVYDQVLRGDDTPELALPSVEPSAAASAGSDPSNGTDSSAGTDAGLTAASAVGAWTIASGAAGYRVTEQLANLPAESEAIGRTTDVTGTATIAASGDSVQVTDAAIDVDTTTISSDKSMRDNRMRNEGLQTDTFQTAGFVLTSPVDVPASAFAGEVVDVTLHGDLTLHGVTKSVDIPAKAQVSGDTIQVQGSISFPLSDYDIVAPNIGGFIVSIADEGALEFLVTFEAA
jgi:polyisoprenoid-binding protein YceI